MNERKKRAVEVIAGRDRISAVEAVGIFGLHESKVANLGPIFHVETAEDGTVASKDVLRALDHRAAERRAAAKPWIDSVLDLRRIGPTQWEIWTPHWGHVGNIGLSLGRDDQALLARPPEEFPVWFAWPVGHVRTHAISARAAQVLVIRAAAPQIIEPSWGKHVRELTTEALEEAEPLASAKRRLQGLRQGSPVHESLSNLIVEKTAEMHHLSAWEIREAEATWNPVARAHEQEQALGRDDPLDAAEAVMGKSRHQWEVRTPEPLQLQTRRTTAAPQWDVEAVADHILVSAATVRSYASRGQMPPPDGNVGGRPWWWPETIKVWHQARRGQGWRKNASSEDV